MPTAFTKPQIVKAVEDLPDDATIEDALERLHFLRKIQKGLVDSESGRTLSLDDLERRLSVLGRWFTRRSLHRHSYHP